MQQFKELYEYNINIDPVHINNISAIIKNFFEEYSSYMSQQYSFFLSRVDFILCFIRKDKEGINF